MGKPQRDRRHLGDAWADWDGAEAGYGESEATVGIFLWPALLAVGAWAAAMAVLWFLVEPRMAQAWLWLPDVLAGLLTLLAIVAVGWWARVAWMSLARRGRGLSRIELLVLLKALLPATLRMGQLIGTSQDRLTNAFLKLHNALTHLARRQVTGDQLVVLLPRCLEKTIRKDAKHIADRYGCSLHIVPGGGEARRVIREKRPRAVVAVACERDLLAGVEEVGLVLPVLALPNRRPEGPCKCTEIDLGDLETAIQSFLGGGDEQPSSIDLPATSEP